LFSGHFVETLRVRAPGDWLRVFQAWDYYTFSAHSVCLSVSLRKRFPM
jgi:hypothetical protein